MSVSRIRKDVFIIAIGRIVQALVMMLAIYLLTTILPPDELGKFYLFMSLVAFPGLVFINPVAQFINRKTNSWHASGNLMQRMYEYNFYVLSVAVASSVILMVLQNIGFFKSLHSSEYALAIFMFVLVNTWAVTLPFLLNMLFERLWFVLLTLLSSLLVLSLSVMWSYQSQSTIDWLFGTISAYAIVALTSLVLFRRKLPKHTIQSRIPAYSEHQKSEILRFVIPLLLATLFMWLQSSGLRVLVEEYFPLNYLAFLGVGLALASQISMTVESIASQIYHPIFYSKIESGNRNDRALALSKILALLLPVYLLMLIFSITFSKEIFQLLVAIEYQTAYRFFMLGMIFEFFRILTNLYANTFHSEMKTYKLILPYLGGAIVTCLSVFVGYQLSNQYQYVIPAIWSVGMVITFTLMKGFSSQLLDVIFPLKQSVTTLLYSSPIIIYGLFFNNSIVGDRWLAFQVLLIAALYSLLVLYLILKGQIRGTDHR